MYLQILGRREYRCIQLYIQPVQEILIHVFQLSLNLDTYMHCNQNKFNEEVYELKSKYSYTCHSYP